MKGIVAVAAVLGAVCGFSSVSMGSYVEMSITQRDVVGASMQYFGTVNIDLTDVANVSAVELGLTPTATFPVADQWSTLRADGAGSYYAVSATESSLSNLLATQIDQYYWIRVSYSGGSSSIYTMTLTTSNISADKFLGTPQITSPASGQLGVPSNATIHWTAPTGATGMPVLAEHETVVNVTITRAMLTNGELSWTPGDLSPTGDKIRIQYPVLDTLNSITPLTLYSGDTIAWGKPSYGTTDGVPTLAFISGQQLTVNYVPEPAALGVLLLCSTALLRRRTTA